jgi:lipopolysaccharide transport protein LptA
MDTLEADLKGHAIHGLGHVVVRQDLWLLCCDQFEATTDETGAWQSMRCKGQVRGYYNGRKLWADRADFSPGAHALTLTGRPRITQGHSHLEGAKMIVRTDTEHVHVVGPKGAMVTEPTDSPPNPPPNFLTGPLPSTCPWPWVP